MVILKAMVRVGFLAQKKASLTANERSHSLLLSEVLLSHVTEAAGLLSLQPQAPEMQHCSLQYLLTLAFSSASNLREFKPRVGYLARPCLRQSRHQTFIFVPSRCP